MKKVFTLIIMSFVVFNYTSTVAQQLGPSIGGPGNVSIPNKFNTVMFVRQKLLPKENRKGSPYLFAKPIKGSIYTRNFGNIKGHAINYNIETKEFDIYTESGTKVLPDIHVDSFEVELLEPSSYKTVTKSYINLLHLSTYQGESSLIGFGKLLSQSHGILISEIIELKITKPNYNQATNTGERAEKIEVKETPYIIKQNKAYKFPLNKSELKLVFGNDLATLKQYAKQEKLNLNKANDFIRSLESLN